MPDAAGAALLAQAMARLSLSARAYHRMLKVARTIADLAASAAIAAPHVAEAVAIGDSIGCERESAGSDRSESAVVIVNEYGR